jgi:predicted O-linked N-acetylglucosamine transferase (SPINDLY family)
MKERKISELINKINKAGKLILNKRYNEALLILDSVLNLDPNNSIALGNKGLVLDKLNRKHEALNAYQKAIKNQPNNYDAIYNYALFLMVNKNFEIAKHYFEMLYKNKPEYKYSLGYLIYVNLHICDWSHYYKYKNILNESDNSEKMITAIGGYLIIDKEKIIYENKLRVTKKIIKKKNASKIKLGFYSCDFRFHPVSTWLVEQIELHDKSKFELIAFNFNSNTSDPMTLRLKAAFDRMIPVENMSDEAVANLSRELEIDIAFDLGGQTQGSRPGIFAARAAPIQINHLGNPGTASNKYIDYFITDKYVVPESSQQYFSEKLLYVDCQYTYDRRRQLSATHLCRSDYGLPENAFVFTCQNNIQKINPEMFDIWMRLLQKIPGSVLWLLQPNDTAIQNLQHESQIRGVEQSRLVFTKREFVPAEQEYERIGKYLSSYKLADLFLDTLPYNAGTTAIDALWAGLPVLTQTGGTTVGRMATSALQALEMHELITKTKEEYEALALELALDKEKLTQIKIKLQNNKNCTALFDSLKNTKNIEKALYSLIEWN